MLHGREEQRRGKLCVTSVMLRPSVIKATKALLDYGFGLKSRTSHAVLERIGIRHVPDPHLEAFVIE
jgi:hypothetical protein